MEMSNEWRHLIGERMAAAELVRLNPPGSGGEQQMNCGCNARAGHFPGMHVPAPENW